MAMTDERLAWMREVANQPIRDHSTVHAGVLSMLTECLDELEQMRGESSVTAHDQAILNRLSRLEERVAVIDDEKDTTAKVVSDVQADRDLRGNVMCSCGRPGLHLRLMGREIGVHCEKCFRAILPMLTHVTDDCIKRLFRDADRAFKNVCAGGQDNG